MYFDEEKEVIFDKIVMKERINQDELRTIGISQELERMLLDDNFIDKDSSELFFLDDQKLVHALTLLSKARCFTEFESLIRILYKLKPNDPSYNYQMFRMCILEGKYDESFQYLDNLFDLKDDQYRRSVKKLYVMLLGHLTKLPKRYRNMVFNIREEDLIVEGDLDFKACPELKDIILSIMRCQYRKADHALSKIRDKELSMRIFITKILLGKVRAKRIEEKYRNLLLAKEERYRELLDFFNDASKNYSPSKFDKAVKQMLEDLVILVNKHEIHQKSKRKESSKSLFEAIQNRDYERAVLFQSSTRNSNVNNDEDLITILLSAILNKTKALRDNNELVELPPEERTKSKSSPSKPEESKEPKNKPSKSIKLIRIIENLDIPLYYRTIVRDAIIKSRDYGVALIQFDSESEHRRIQDILNTIPNISYTDCIYDGTNNILIKHNYYATVAYFNKLTEETKEAHYRQDVISELQLNKKRLLFANINSAWSYLNLGISLSKLNAPDDAMFFFKLALSIDSTIIDSERIQQLCEKLEHQIETGNQTSISLNEQDFGIYEIDSIQEDFEKGYIRSIEDVQSMFILNEEESLVAMLLLANRYISDERLDIADECISMVTPFVGNEGFATEYYNHTLLRIQKSHNMVSTESFSIKPIES